jgi:hypothetical protein
MNHVALEFAWQLFDDQGVVWTFIDANSTADAKALRNVRLARFVIEDDAFLTISNRWAEGMTFIVALLWLTTVFLQNGYSHCLTPSPCVDVIG